MQSQVPGAAATGGGASAPGGMPDMRYSTARSGLLYAARMALTTSSRGKPMSTICTPASTKPCGVMMKLSNLFIWCGTTGQYQSTRHVHAWIVLEHKWCGTIRQYDSTRHIHDQSAFEHNMQMKPKTVPHQCSASDCPRSPSLMLLRHKDHHWMLVRL